MCCVCMYIHTHIHILTHNGIITHLKKKELLPFMTPWMDLEGFMPDESRQKKRNTV